MIRYRLKCRKGHEFEGWFKSSDAFDRQAKRGQVSCGVCGSTQVSKAPMAPSVKTRRRAAVERRDEPREAPAVDGTPGSYANAEAAKASEMRAMLRKLRDEVKAKAEYVGPRFAEEARRIHNAEAPERGIYGEATMKEARELADDGIGVMPLPEFPEDKN